MDDVQPGQVFQSLSTSLSHVTWCGANVDDGFDSFRYPVNVKINDQMVFEFMCMAVSYFVLKYIVYV